MYDQSPKLFHKHAVFFRVLFLLTLFVSLPSNALEEPACEVLLTIDGNIPISNAVENDKPVALFDLKLLKSLNPTTFKTSSPWSEKASEFTGVRLDELLAAVGVDHENTIVRAAAANDYWFDLENLNLDQYPIMVAYEKDSKPLSVRERGPLWIVFPWDMYPSLLNEKNKASSVWQLLTLTVQ